MVTMKTNSHIRAGQREAAGRPVIFRHGYALAGLIIIAAIAYWPFYAPILYGDDWSFIIGRWYYDILRWVDIREQRPLLKAPLLILYTIFGLNVHAFYGVLWTLNVTAAVQLYFILLRFIPKNAPIVFVVSALVLIYPADFTHMWLTMIVIRLVIVLTLAYAHLLLVYADTGSRIALGAAWLCLAISLGMYEGQLGLVLAWSVFLALLKRREARRRWLGLLTPLFVGLVFSAWRIFISSVVALGNNYAVSRFELAPLTIIQRLIVGHRILVWSWLEPLTNALNLNVLTALIVLLLAMFCGGVIVFVSSRAYRLSATITPGQHREQMRRFAVLMLIGPLFITAGYLPVTTIFQPSLFPLFSRTNIFALPGAAVTLAALLVLLVGQKQRQVNWPVSGMLIPLILLGVMVQAQVQSDNRIAWERQKQLWRDLFALAPDLKPETTVYIILAEPEEETPSLNRNGIRPTLRARWEVDAAVNVLYGRYDLKADVFTKELLLMDDRFLLKYFLREGEIVNDLGQSRPYNQALFVAYDGRPRRLRIIEDLEAEQLADFPTPGYDPYDRIIDTPSTGVALRCLVEDVTC